MTVYNFLLILTGEGSKNVDFVMGVLHESGVKVLCVRRNDKSIELYLRVGDEEVERAAEQLRYELQNVRLNHLKVFSVKKRNEFLSSSDGSKSGSMFFPAEWIFLSEYVLRRTKLSFCINDHTDELATNNFITKAWMKDFFPLHDNDNCIKELTKSLLNCILLPKNDYIRNYFGEEVAIYFEWMRHFTTFLIVPSILAVIVVCMGSDCIVDRNPYVPLYSMFVVAGGFLFCKSWRRRSNELALRWNTLFVDESFSFNPNFYGLLRVSPVTGLMELHYVKWKRRLKLCFSLFITILMLCIAFILMIAGLNLQGLIQYEDRFGRVNVFYIHFLASLSQSGAIFDPSGSFYFSCWPCIFYSIGVYVLNQFIYRRIAEWLTHYENHKLLLDFDRSLILKRYLFEAFDCYIALFYLAFHEVDVMRVREVLLGLYVTDSIRRITFEFVIPYIMYRERLYWNVKPCARPPVDEGYPSRDVYLTEYEQFDDYLEMIIVHGYITLFASSCPLTSVLSLIFNVVEVKSDLFKLLTVSRRPFPKRRKDLGIWEDLIYFQSWFAILTNVLIFAFSSEQMMQWFPQLFNHIPLNSATFQLSQLEHELKDGSGRYVLTFIIVLEHLFILIGLLIGWLIHDQPGNVRNAIALRQHRLGRLVDADKSD